MTSEGFRYYLIFQLFVLCSAFVPDFLNHSKTSDRAETQVTLDTSSTLPDPRVDQPPTSNSLSTKLSNSELPSTSYVLKNYSKSLYQSEVWNITQEIDKRLKQFRTEISETPILDGKNVACIQDVLNMEILIMMATGNHFIIPPNGDKKIEKRLGKNVRAFYSIWLDLRYVVDFETIRSFAISETIPLTPFDQVGFPKSRVTIEKMQEYLLNAVNEIFNAIDDRDDSLANDFFEHRKSFANKEPVTYFSFDNLTLGIIEETNIAEWLKNLDIRKGLIHIQFVHILFVQQNPVVQLFYSMALESKLPINLNEIYTNILDKVAKLHIVNKIPQEDIIRDIINEIIIAIKTHEPLKKAYEDANIDYEKEIQSLKIR